MSKVEEYELGLIRTDRGEHVDKGNIAVDPTHPDFAGRKDIMNGVVDATEAFEAADTHAQLYGLDLVLRPGTYSIQSNLTLTSGIRIPRGASLKPASGVTVTINGSLNAKLHQIFDTSVGGSIAFGKGSTEKLFPQWWGAKGDGTTDDRAAIQAAIDAAQTNIGVVYFSEGIYGVANSGASRWCLRCRSNVSLVGTSRHSSTIRSISGSTDGVLLFCSGISDFSIRRLGFHLDNAHTGSSNTDRCVEISNNCTRFEVKACRFEMDTSQMLLVNESSVGLLSENLLYDPTQSSGVNGITTTENSDLVITDNLCKDLSDTSIFVQDSDRVTVADNVVVSEGTAFTLGIDLFGSRGCSVVGNIIRGNREDGRGIRIAASTTGLSREPFDVVVANNYVERVGLRGIDVISDTGRIIVANNVCSDNGVYGIRVTRVSSPGKGFVIVGNICYDNGWDSGAGAGIFCIMQESIVAHNVAYDTGASVQETGIDISSSTAGLSAYGNHVFDNTSTDFSGDQVELTGGEITTPPGTSSGFNGAGISNRAVTIRTGGDGRIGLEIRANSGSQVSDLQGWKDQNGIIFTRVNKAGYFATRKTSAPADADVSTSELILWFDDTNGAGKAMFKGKTADGTVVTGSVALS